MRYNARSVLSFSFFYVLSLVFSNLNVFELSPCGFTISYLLCGQWAIQLHLYQSFIDCELTKCFNLDLGDIMSAIDQSNMTARCLLKSS